jgi:cytoskeletal protein CcmA (bactofilin family)
MASSQASTYRILAGVLALKSFTVNNLARFSQCLPGTVRTTLNRNREYIEALSAQPSGKRGGQPLRYRLIPEKESELDHWLRTSLPQLQIPSVPLNPEAEGVKNLAVSFDPALRVAEPTVFREYAAEEEGHPFSMTLASPISLREGQVGNDQMTQFNRLAPSGMLVAAEQLGEIFEAAETPLRRSELLEEANDSMRAGRAEFESWPATKKQSSLGLSVVAELENLGRKLQFRAHEVEPLIAGSVTVPAHIEQMRTIERDLEAIQVNLRRITKAPRFFGGGFPAASNRILIDSLVESDIAFPDGDIEIAITGDVHANISARSVKVRGRIEGNLVASVEVSLLAGCRLLGDITASRISIEDGAFFKGGIDIRKTRPSTAWVFANQADAIEAAKAAISEGESAAEVAAPMLHAGLRLSSY